MISTALNYGYQAVRFASIPRSPRVAASSAALTTFSRALSLAYVPQAINRMMTQSVEEVGRLAFGTTGARAGRLIGDWVITPASYLTGAPQATATFATRAIPLATYYTSVTMGNFASWSIQSARIAHARQIQQATSFECGEGICDEPVEMS